jgi:putative transposase
MTEALTAYKRRRFPAQLIAYAVWLYFRFPLSLRLIEELLLEREIVVSYETIRRWAAKIGPAIARGVRHPGRATSGTWMRSSSGSGISSITSGGPSTSTAMSSMFWCRAGAMPRRPSASSRSC